MKKIFIFPLLCCLIFSAIGQNSSTIENELSADHLRVEGTRFSMIPPVGFAPATDYSGFRQKASNSTIFVSELPNGLARTQAGFTKEALMKKGMFVKSSETFQLNGFDASFLTAEQYAFGAKVVKLILLFGNEQESFLIQGSYPKDIDDLKPMMINAIKSVVVEME